MGSSEKASLSVCEAATASIAGAMASDTDSAGQRATEAYRPLTVAEALAGVPAEPYNPLDPPFVADVNGWPIWVGDFVSELQPDREGVVRAGHVTRLYPAVGYITFVIDTTNRTVPGEKVEVRT